MTPIRIRVVAIVLSMAFWSVGGADATLPSAKAQTAPAAISSRRMLDGKQWMTKNLNVDTAGSFCQEDAELNCSRYGRLYTWESAKLACPSLGARMAAADKRRLAADGETLRRRP